MEVLLNSEWSPIMLVLAVVCMAWAWEDAALITGALLAVDQQLSVVVSLIAILVGIMSGDLALYWLGRFGHNWRWLRVRLLRPMRMRRTARKLRRRPWLNILLIRFVPGLRTLGFTLCGYWRVGLGQFSLAILFAGVVWIAIIFSVVYNAGSSELLVNSPAKWYLMCIALLMLLVNNLPWYRWVRNLKSNG